MGNIVSVCQSYLGRPHLLQFRRGWFFWNLRSHAVENVDGTTPLFTLDLGGFAPSYTRAGPETWMLAAYTPAWGRVSPDVTATPLSRRILGRVNPEHLSSCILCYS